MDAGWDEQQNLWNLVPGEGPQGPTSPIRGSVMMLGAALLPSPLPTRVTTLRVRHHPRLGYLVFALLAVEQVFLEESRDVALVQQEGSEHP